MILVFGGTTEGRTAAKVLEELGSTYFYSTRSDTQDIQLVHGHHIIGAMDCLRWSHFAMSIAFA